MAQLSRQQLELRNLEHEAWTNLEQLRLLAKGLPLRGQVIPNLPPSEATVTWARAQEPIAHEAWRLAYKAAYDAGVPMGRSAYPEEARGR